MQRVVVGCCCFGSLRLITSSCEFGESVSNLYAALIGNSSPNKCQVLVLGFPNNYKGMKWPQMEMGVVVAGVFSHFLRSGVSCGEIGKEDIFWLHTCSVG